MDKPKPEALVGLIPICPQCNRKLEAPFPQVKPNEPYFVGCEYCGWKGHAWCLFTADKILNLTTDQVIPV